MSGKSILTVAIFLLLLCSSAVSADLVFEGNGDATRAPYFRSQAYFGYQLPKSISYGIEQGTVYDNNIAPRSLHLNFAENRNGANVSMVADTVFNGFFSARNSATMTINNVQAGDGYYGVGGMGTRSRVQFFTPEAAAARATFRWNVTGTDSSPFGDATGRLDFLAGQYSDRDFFAVFDSSLNPMSVRGPGTFTYNLTNTPLNTPIDLMFWTSAYTQLDRGLAPQGSNVVLSANYAHTYDLAEIQLFDADDHLIPEWTMQDMDSGEVVFDQNGRVPEPSFLGIVALALTALVRRR